MLNQKKSSDVDVVCKIYGLVSLPFAVLVTFGSAWILKEFLTGSPDPEHTYAFVVWVWILTGAVLNMLSGFTSAFGHRSYIARELILMLELACLVLSGLMIGDPDSLTFLGGSSCGLGLGMILLVNALGCRYGTQR